MKRLVAICGCLILSCGMIPSSAQSLGEVAREERARRDGNQNPSRRVYTNEELSKPSTAPLESPDANHAKDSTPTKADAAGQAQASGKDLQSKIHSQKQKVRELQTQIQKLERRIDERDSIGNVGVSQRVTIQGTGTGPGWCALSKAMNSDPYKEWCDESVKWAAELEKRTAGLKEARTALEGLQEQARKLGYGSAFYDPE